ncbi:TetR family transcriptional regulator [Variovorax sp. PBL-E5]|uniref:TetR family transcriptional regulator n=1 Tax=Variovorax sp. PBL-E5 TaxID=434014 RepID=UPI0013170538|nr:TetR family transcriptional regulator [Variovorax sp. PBL-E5]VTU17554.1 Toluene efflux pump ttgABC operon repressor [Variovorax sp. PBL-E5]
MVRRTKEEALETRHRLLDAAEVLFQAQGVSQTSLQQIAQQAGATRGAIYWHFKDKADLFNAMMERVKLPLEAAVQKAAGGIDADPMDEVERMMVEALKIMTTDPQVRRVFEVATHKVEYTHDMASVQERHLAARNACVLDFEKAMLGAARRARIRLPLPAAVAAQGLHALISGLIQNWLLDPSAFDLVGCGRRTFRVYLAGLGFVRPLASAAPDRR